MEQLRSQQSGGGDDAMGMGETYLVDLDHAAMDLSDELDGAILMELMEDFPSSDLLDGDVDRLGHVIRSLEAEIGGGAGTGDVTATMVGADSVVIGASSSGDDGGRMIEETLSESDLDGGYEGGSFGCYWPEASLPGHEAEGWCVYVNGYEGGGVVEHETFDHRYYCAEEGGVELLYSPLWE